MAMIAEVEEQQIEAANATGRTPVVFIHGLWLLPSSWDRWAGVFEEAGYGPTIPRPLTKRRHIPGCSPTRPSGKWPITTPP